MSGSGSVFGRARVLDDATLKRHDSPAKFGTAGVSVATKPGRLYKVRVSNANATTAYYVQFFNKATAPVANDVAIWEIPITAKAPTTAPGDAAEDFGLFGLFFSIGLGMALSTTPRVLTLAAADDATAHLLYAANT